MAKGKRRRKSKEDIYWWMDQQIMACDIQLVPLDFNDPFYINNASGTKAEIHVFGIDNLCKELDIPFNVEEHSKGLVRHYFMYKNHKFFGLVEKGESHERK